MRFDWKDGEQWIQIQFFSQTKQKQAEYQSSAEELVLGTWTTMDQPQDLFQGSFVLVCLSVGIVSLGDSNDGKGRVGENGERSGYRFVEAAI